MVKIKDIQTALEIFEKASVKHAEATEQGDYLTGNKCYQQITKAASFLKNEHAISALQEHLYHPSTGVRLWAACYWLPVNESEGIEILQEIASKSGILSLTAEVTINEWRKGNLKF